MAETVCQFCGAGPEGEHTRRCHDDALDRVAELEEAIASALTSLATGPMKDGYAYAVLSEVAPKGQQLNNEESTMKSRPMARYTLPGSFFNESDAVELPERSVEAAVEAAPKHAFAFVLFDSPICDFEFPADLFRLVPIPQDESHRFYLGGELFDGGAG